MRTSLLVAVLSLVAAPAWGQRARPLRDTPLTFSGRHKIESQGTRMFKISVDPVAVPLDSDTLTAILNTPALAGAAAKQVFGLPEDAYGAYVELRADSRVRNSSATVQIINRGQMVLARVDVTIRADRRLAASELDAFIEGVRARLERTLTESVDIDRQHIEKRREKLIRRRAEGEEERNRLWSKRVELAEHAGLAETTVQQLRQSISRVEGQRDEVEMELVLKRAQVETLRQSLGLTDRSRRPDAGSPAATGDPDGFVPDVGDDPLTDELENIVRLRARQLDALHDSAGATEEDLNGSRLQLAEAKVRWEQRLEELRETSPAHRLKATEQEIARLEARRRHLEDHLDRVRTRARDLFRYSEQVALITEQEARAIARLDRFEEQIEELITEAEKVEEVDVTVLGRIPGS